VVVLHCYQVIHRPANLSSLQLTRMMA